MGNLFSWQIKENFFLFESQTKLLQRFHFYQKYLHEFCKRHIVNFVCEILWVTRGKNIFLWKGIIFGPFQRSITFYAALYDRWEFSFKTIIMVIFLIFELSKKELIKNILVKGYGGTVEPRYNDMLRDIFISRNCYKLPIYRYDRKITENIVISG